MSSTINFEWKVPHVERSYAEALTLGSDILKQVAFESRGRIFLPMQTLQGEPRKFVMLLAVGCEYPGIMVADRLNITYFGPLTSLSSSFLSNSIRQLLIVQARHRMLERELAVA